MTDDEHFQEFKELIDRAVKTYAAVQLFPVLKADGPGTLQTRVRFAVLQHLADVFGVRPEVKK